MNPNEFKLGKEITTINKLTKGKKYVEAILCAHLVIENQLSTLIYHEACLKLTRRDSDPSRWKFICDFSFSKKSNMAYVLSIIDKKTYSKIKAINTYRNQEIAHGLIYRTLIKKRIMDKITGSLRIIKKLENKIKRNLKIK